MLLDAAASFDVVITCGGVSAGERDFLPALVQAEGAVYFWKVRMKPGMPLLFGRLERAQLLALPGNPVSVLATWLTLGRPLLEGLQGSVEPRPRWHARLAAGFDKRNSRREFLRGRSLPGADGNLAVRPNPADGSHRLAAAADSDVLIVLPEGERAFAVGDIVEVLPY
jgi:molybdopterin molybdotransferase